jgi:hypothetical protein
VDLVLEADSRSRPRPRLDHDGAKPLIAYLSTGFALNLGGHPDRQEEALDGSAWHGSGAARNRWWKDIAQSAGAA